MKKIICIMLCAVMCLCLFGCSATQNQNIEIEEQKEGTLSNASVVFFKTDNDADCSLLKYNDTYILIDTGEKKDGKKIAKFLAENGVSTLDYIILSHFDKDHCGGAVKILKEINAKKVLHPQYIKDNDESEKLFEVLNDNGIDAESVSQTQAIELDGLSLLLLPANKQSYVEKESNNSSLVVKAEFCGKSVLFTGDCQEARVDELLACDEDLSCDILKLMYHGRYVANENELLGRINPSYTIITGDKDSKKVKQNIDNIKSNIGEYYFTSDGNVVFSVAESEITVNR